MVADSGKGKKVDKTSGSGGSAVVLSEGRRRSQALGSGGRCNRPGSQGSTRVPTLAMPCRLVHDAYSRYGFYGDGTLPRVLCDEEHTAEARHLTYVCAHQSTARVVCLRQRQRRAALCSAPCDGRPDSLMRSASNRRWSCISSRNRR